MVLEDNRGGKSPNHNTAPTNNTSSSSASSANPSANLNQLFKPVPVLPNPDDMNLGEEIAGKMNKQALLKTLNALYLSKSIKELSKEHGMDDYIYHQVTIVSQARLIRLDDRFGKDLFKQRLSFLHNFQLARYVLVQNVDNSEYK